ncbi:hypothetical protein ACFX58_04625 [Sphingomonas sp. NCPPB 2930]
MNTSSDSDSQQRFALGLMGVLIVVLLAVVVGSVVQRQWHPHHRRAAVADSTSVEGARVLIEEGIVKIYFAPGSAALASSAEKALADVVKGMGVGMRAVVLSYQYPALGPNDSAALIRRRAAQVREMLMGLGLPDDKIELRSPAQAGGSSAGEDRELANRIDVMLVN